jgi:hypothetical protein
MYVAVIIPLVNVIIDGNHCSSVVCSLDSNITLRSCDRVLFKFYRKKLESYSQAFAGSAVLGPASGREPGQAEPK